MSQQIDYLQYLDYATPRQKEYINSWAKNNKNISKVAKEFGVNRGTISKALKRVLKKAGATGFDFELGVNKRPPHGFQVSGYRVDSKGNYIPGYAKPDQNIQLEDMMDFIEDRVLDLKPFKPTKFNKKTKDDLLNVYTLTDCHIGQLSWGKEAGKDWDLDIAKKLILQAFAEMIESSPQATQCFVNQLGDFLHIDSHLPVTPASRHPVRS